MPTAAQLDIMRRTAVAARDYCRLLGLDSAHVRGLTITTVRQVIQESGAGTSENAREANNFFGQKSRIRISATEANTDLWATGERVLSQNPEWVGGKLVYDTTTPFYTYASLEDSVRAHIDYITGRSGLQRYADPGRPSDPDEIAGWLVTPPRGYATDPTYAQSLRTLDARWGVTPLADQLLQEAPTMPAEMPITIPAVATKIIGPQRVRLIVLHTAECPCKPGKALAVAKYFAGESAEQPGGVAHYTVDPESTTHSVPEATACAHAGAASRLGSVGIEMCGYSADQWTDAAHQATMRRAAALARDVAARWRVPLVRLTAADLAAGKRSGYTYHRDVTASLGGTSHTDPGPNFPYDLMHELIAGKGADPLSSVVTKPILDVDGIRGPLTIKRLQQYLGGLDQDGILGPKTVARLQRYLGVPQTGSLDKSTIRALQARVGVTVDGLWGSQTTRGLQGWLNAQR